MLKVPSWAIALYLIGGFVPSLLAIFLTWKKEGTVGVAPFGAPHRAGQPWLALVFGGASCSYPSNDGPIDHY